MRGITLLEVMISIFVLAIGLLGVASLLPVAAFQAQRATIDDRKSAVGQTIIRDIKVRGFLRADYWLLDTVPLVPAVNSAGAFVDADGVPLKALIPVAIDPLIVASVGATGNANAFAGGGQLVMPRYTLSTCQAGPAAAQACMNQDDLAFTPSTSNTNQLPTGGYNTNGTKRSFIGQYSWLATLVPVYGDEQTVYNRNQMILSVVVFNQRRLGVPPAHNPGPWPDLNALATDTERAAAVQFLGLGYGGGDLQLTATVPAGQTQNNVTTFAIGEWLMLGWMLKDVPPTGANTNYTTRPFFRWYRIVVAGPVTVSGSSWSRYVTVNGADVNLNSLVPVNNVQAYAFIYDGAVAVYERPVRLEGPSMWSLY